MESVLAVKTALLRPFLRERGLITDNLDAALELIAERHDFLPRPIAEGNPDYKQVIPYVALVDGEKVFATRRLPESGETRLHGLISLGVGGHIAQTDGAGRQALLNGMRRELREEVSIEEEGTPRFAGLINDDGTEVGKVHLGLFCVLPVRGRVRVRETGKLEGFWLRRAELRGRESEMESWSGIVLDALGA